MERTVQSVNYDYMGLRDTVSKLRENYPFLRYEVIGKSCAGREIFALRLGRGESATLFTAAFHGSEHITTNIIMMFLEELCHCLKSGGSIAGLNARKAIWGREIIIIPRVNPDGCEISIHGRAACGNYAPHVARICKNDFVHYNANLRGVDINHNFDAGWQELRERERQSGINGPAPTRFGGYKPESEPETVALCELCRKNRIHHTLALHSQGEVIYWTYGDSRPPKSQRMAEIMATACGYALDAPVGLAQGGGFKDWFISEFNRPGFTVEVGLGKNPLPCESAGEIYLKVREMLTLSAIM